MPCGDDAAMIPPGRQSLRQDGLYRFPHGRIQDITDVSRLIVTEPSDTHAFAVRGRSQRVSSADYNTSKSSSKLVSISDTEVEIFGRVFFMVVHRDSP